MSREEIREKKHYYTIVSGTFRTVVDKDDPIAVRRDWATADGKKSGTKYERIVDALRGYIEDIQFYDGEFGMQVLITLDENTEGYRPVIALNMASREGESFVKRLPSIDLTREVRLRPYAFDGSEGGEVRGIEVLQPDEEGKFKTKVPNFFYDEVKKVNVNGYPEPEGDTADYTKEDWKIYFMQCRKFIVTYAKTHVVPKFAEGVMRSPTQPEEKNEGRTAKEAAEREVEGQYNDLEGEANPEEIPF